MNRETMTTEQIWDLFGTKLKTFLRKRVSDEQVAEDLLQETFVRIHRSLSSIDETERITPWVYRIARNLLVDHYRSKAKDFAALADDLAVETKEERKLNDVVMDWMPCMIAQLPRPYREAVELYELEGQSQQEVADRLNLSLSGAKSRIQRGRDKLKTLLFDCCSFEQDRRGNLIDFDRNQPGNDCGNGCDD